MNWPAIKVLLLEAPPLLSRGITGIAAAFILLAIALFRGERVVAPSRALPAIGASAFTNVFAWMGFSTIAMRWLTVAECALLVYTMPIWTTLLAWPVLGMRPTVRSTLALVMGVGGITLLLGAENVVPEPNMIWGILLALAAAICFAFGSVLNRKPIPLTPLVSVAWQVGLGSLALVLAGLLYENPSLASLTARSWWIMAYMSLVPMGVCYLAWFAALRYLPPAMASTGILMVPVTGVVAAAFFLGEPFGWVQVGALALTLGGVTLALQKS